MRASAAESGAQPEVAAVQPEAAAAQPEAQPEASEGAPASEPQAFSTKAEAGEVPDAGSSDTNVDMTLDADRVPFDIVFVTSEVRSGQQPAGGGAMHLSAEQAALSV